MTRSPRAHVSEDVGPARKSVWELLAMFIEGRLPERFRNRLLPRLREDNDVYEVLVEATVHLDRLGGEADLGDVN